MDRKHKKSKSAPLKTLLLMGSVGIVAIWAISIVLSLNKTVRSLPNMDSIDLPTVHVPATNERVMPVIQSTIESEIEPDSDEGSQTESPEPTPIAFEQGTIPVPIHSSTLSVPQRCELLKHWGYFPGESVDQEVYRRMSDEALEELAEIDDDGYAQYVLATRIRNRYWDEYFSGAPLDFDEQLQKMKENYIKAFRHHNTDAGHWLMLYEYRMNNKVEAMAWRSILMGMAGDWHEGLGIDLTGYFRFTEQEQTEGAARVQELITEHDLTPGLSPPEVCA